VKTYRKNENEAKIPLNHQERVAVERVASRLGVSLGELFRVSVLMTMKFNLLARDRIALSKREWKEFKRVFNEPAKPDKALIAAARKFRESLSP
jgi:uncharacterized protein (DUF1778 family)